MKEKVLKVFNSKQELEESVAQELIAEFKKPGFILLPAGKTFEMEIYPMIEEYFSKNPSEINGDLIVSHLDERITDKKEYLFSEGIKKALPSLSSKFISIDPQDLGAFDKLLKRNGGPRLIYFGLGSDPSRAHIAYIGEEYINETTAKIKLSESMRPEPGITHALTMGTDLFNSENLEAIRVVVIGLKKRESLQAGFNDVNTGLGFLLENHSAKTTLYKDSP